MTRWQGFYSVSRLQFFQPFIFLSGQIRELSALAVICQRWHFLRTLKLVWRHLTQISLHPLRSHCVLLAETEPPCPLSDGSPTYCYLPVFCSGMLLNNGSHVGSWSSGMSRDKTAIVHTFLGIHSQNMLKCVKALNLDRTCSTHDLNSTLCLEKFLLKILSNVASVHLMWFLPSCWP